MFFNSTHSHTDKHEKIIEFAHFVTWRLYKTYPFSHMCVSCELLQIQLGMQTHAKSKTKNRPKTAFRAFCKPKFSWRSCTTQAEFVCVWKKSTHICTSLQKWHLRKMQITSSIQVYQKTTSIFFLEANSDIAALWKSYIYYCKLHILICTLQTQIYLMCLHIALCSAYDRLSNLTH